MEQKDKELLLKDLCARLPYGVYIRTNNKKILKLWGIGQDDINGYWVNSVYELDGVKPYLRPMSSMTEEERKEYHKLCNIDEEYGVGGNPVIIAIHDTPESLDYLNSIHIDYRGLIDESNAIEVTEKNNPYKD